MKKLLLIIVLGVAFFLISPDAAAQCSICSKTVAQMGEKPARGLNAGILYLAFTPLALIGFIAFRWWRKNKNAPDGTPAI